MTQAIGSLVVASMTSVRPCAVVLIRPRDESERSMMDDEPSPPVRNGRLADGRFGPGNRHGVGNPTLRKIHALRLSLLGAMSPERMARVGERLMVMAESGDLEAIKTLLTYT